MIKKCTHLGPDTHGDLHKSDQTEDPLNADSTPGEGGEDATTVCRHPSLGPDTHGDLHKQ